MSNEAIAKAVDAYFADMSAMNGEEWIKNFTDDATIYDPVGKPPNQAKDSYQKFFGILSMVFARLELTQDNVFPVENGAAVKWTMRGTGKNGKEGKAEGISVFELNENGKIKQVCSYWDDDAMMAQIKD